MNQQESVKLQELQREFDVNEFESVVFQLLSTMKIHTNLQICGLYNEIKSKCGRVIGKDILEVLHILKEQANFQKEVDKQISYFRTVLRNLKNSQKQILTIGEFFISFVLNNPKRGFVTDEIQSQLSEIKSISIEKLQILIDDIQQSRLQNRILRPYGSSRIRKQLDRTFVSDFTLDSTDFVQNELIAAMNNKIMENIEDSKQKQHCLSIMAKISESLQYAKQNQIRIEDETRQRKKSELQWEEEADKYQQIIEQKNEEINKLLEENQKLQQQFRDFQDNFQQDFVQIIEKLQNENKMLKKQKKNLQIQSRNSNMDVRWFEQNMSELYEQYKSHKQVSLKQIKQLQEEAKQSCNDLYQIQLKEAESKISKIRKQNSDLRIKLSDLQVCIKSKQIREGIRTQRTPRPFILRQNLGAQFNFNEEDDITKQMPFKSFRKGSASFNFDENLDRSETISIQKSKSRKVFKQMTKQYLNQQDSIKYPDKLPKQNQENTKNIIQIKQTLKYRLNKYDFIGILKTSVLKDLTNLLQRGNNNNNQKLKSIFSCKILLIKRNFYEKEMNLIISSNKFMFYKGEKLQKSLNISELLNITICQQNKTLLVIKTKVGLQKKFDDIVLKTNLRTQFVQYYSQQLSEKINIVYQKQQSILIIEGNKIQTLISFKSKQNKKSLTIYDEVNIFQAKMQADSFFSKSQNIYVLINEIGLIVFPRHKINQRQLKIKHIFQINNSVQVIQIAQENKIKIVYPDKKSKTFQFCSYALTKLFSKTLTHFKQSQLKRIQQYRTLLQEQAKDIRTKQIIF